MDIPLKSKAFWKADGFGQFKAKIFLRTIGMAIGAAGCIYLLYSFLLKGNFADWTVEAYQKIFRLDWQAARTLYQWTFRNYIDLIFLAGILLVFFIVFRIYLNWFAKYFIEINRGIDKIGSGEEGEVVLPPELAATEKKMNALKHTLEKQKLDARLAEQRKNDLIMYLAHDLKTPLASVIGYLNLLRDEKEISGELREKYLSVSLEKAQRLDDLFHEFFEVAQYSLSNIELRYGSINLTRLLEMVLYEFQPMLHEKGLDCSIRANEDISLLCDGDKMQRVFDNLLRNAVLYSFPGTKIEIGMSRQGENAEVTFTNQGDDIPEEKLERIFEQFYRLDASRGTEGGGTGLGLAIAKQIVELHHGTITAKSRDGMVEFKVLLPISA